MAKKDVPMQALGPHDDPSGEYHAAPSSPVLTRSGSSVQPDGAVLSPRHPRSVKARRSQDGSKSSTPDVGTPSVRVQLGTPRHSFSGIPRSANSRLWQRAWDYPVAATLILGLLLTSLCVITLLRLTADPSAPSVGRMQHAASSSSVLDWVRPAGSAKQPAILVTGGAGYIGSHTSLLLLEAGYRVVIVDNLSNSKPEAIDRLKDLAGEEAARRLEFHAADLCHAIALEKVFVRSGPFQAVVHFAGLKAVGESIAVPMRYYHNNLVATMNLVDSMTKHGCKNLVFSSSATVYGQPKDVPCTEESPLSATNPYGRTKLMSEEMLRDLHTADPSWRIALLRYFNPVGAHPSGQIGEDPQGIPNNLMPYMTEVALGLRPELNVYGSDYNTSDGTGVRDYIHVMDLAAGHIAAVQKIATTDNLGCVAYNLGTGKGTSVLQLHAALERASGKHISLKKVGRRPGDVAELYAGTAKAESELGWRAERNIDEMCRDQWRWASESLARLKTQEGPGKRAQPKVGFRRES